MDIATGHCVPELIAKGVLTGKKQTVKRRVFPGISHQGLVADFVVALTSR